MYSFFILSNSGLFKLFIRLKYLFRFDRAFLLKCYSIFPYSQSAKMVSIKKLGIGGGCMFFFGIVTWCGFPSLIRSQIKKVIIYKFITSYDN